MFTRQLAGAALAAAILLPSLGAALPAAAKDFLLTATKPNQLHLVDPAERKVVKTFTIPGPPTPFLITPAPDGKVAYVVSNGWGSISGINLDTGKEVFRADLSTPEVRTKVMAGMDVSPDGKELFVMTSSVRILPGEYEVLDTKVAVFDTAAGLNAKPVRTLPIPRRTGMLMLSKDGSRLYALGWDLYVLDPQTGHRLDTVKLRTWERPGYAEPDILDVWPQWEQAGVFSTPYFVPRTDVEPTAPDAMKTGLLTLDLKTGQSTIKDFENTAVVIFSSVVSPVDPKDVYAVYTQLSKIDNAKGELVKRVDLDHTYYAVNISADGKEVYLGGTMDDIAVYSTTTLEKLATITLPGGGDQGIASMRFVKR